MVIEQSSRALSRMCYIRDAKSIYPVVISQVFSWLFTTYVSRKILFEAHS